jgi:hypothetical protein
MAKWIAQKVEVLEEGARCHMASNEAVKEYDWGSSSSVKREEEFERSDVLSLTKSKLSLPAVSL